ncbi:LysR family transcriptional regulator [Roseospira marina]|uniref:HTH-type transcriptional regulator CbbR n=1 Tax=Roseospira marina TaxID=140057 RepID=A0A5M6IHL4_9PROT|nr:LysR family transcriptional regulator [Roseospira marina]KAA5607279.1 LysR family transcriptional regulator [Roseospira marina]MBB4312566.1 DNA-binding transcriptional LysR family regulator [Roseospira marina]MBB5085418.1 DNA-binding transcriptional LysR family regulator [Roseospira marina]
MSVARDVTLKHLRGFAEVLRRGTIASAAERLHLTAPAVSTQLKTLEALVGAPILDRSGEVLRPTEVGEELLRAAGLIEAALSRCEERIDSLKDGAAGLVRLGVVSTGKYFAPRLVARFNKAAPGITLHLVVGNRDETVEALHARGIDLAVMGRGPEDLDVIAYRLGPHPYVLIAPPDHPQAGRPEADAEALLSETFLAREIGSGTRTLMMRELDRLGGGRAYRVVEMASNETIKQAVMAGLGIALLSAHTVHSELAEGKLITLALPRLPIMRHWYLIHRADETLTPAAEVFRDFVVGLNGAFLPRLEGASPPAQM